MGSDREQMALFNEDFEESALVEYEKKGGVHTAEDFEKNRPGETKLIQLWVLAGLSQREISRQLKCSRNIVSLIAQKMMEMNLDGMKEAVGKKLRNLALIGTEELMRRVQHCPELMGTKDLAVMVGVAVQNSQLLSGHATEIHQWDKREELTPSEADYERMLLEEQKKVAIDVSVVDERGMAAVEAGKDGGDV